MWGDAAAGPTAMPATEGALAVALMAAARQAGRRGLIHVARSADRAERLAGILRVLAPGLAVLHLPPWDCLPYDRAPPSAAAMGRRVAVFARLAAGMDEPHLILASPGALLQRVPPRTVWGAAVFTVSRGAPLDLDALRRFLLRTGHRVDDRVDEPGEAAIRGEVVDVFPAGADGPCRIDHADGRVAGIRLYDAATQRTTGECRRLDLRPASEAVTAADAPREPGLEHRLPRLYPHLETLFDLAPEAAAILEPEVPERVRTVLSIVADAHETRTRLAAARRGGDERPPAPAELYLTGDAWDGALAGRPVRLLERPAEGADGAVPRPAGAGSPGRRLAALAAACRDAGRRLVLAAPAGAPLRRLARFAERHLGAAPVPAASWAEVDGHEAGTVLLLEAVLPQGFRTDGALVLTAAEVLGPHAGAAAGAAAVPPFDGGGDLTVGDGGDLTVGEAVVHLDHGLALLRGAEPIDTPDGPAEAVRLEFRGGDTLLVPTEDLGRVWRYGAGGTVALDGLNSGSWERRRDEVAREVARTAGELVRRVGERLAAPAPALVPPAAAYERFAARFPYAETPDQAATIAAVLDDLGKGRPMDRIVCGDVGYGKTEVALRAAAAAALAGRQVAVVAPTTVLARQHLETFRARFAGSGLEIGHLSRLAGTAEARETKRGLKDGRIRIVVGTHALAGKGVAFRDLGLLIVDEEQRFGVRAKASLRDLGGSRHRLTLTATPIPRTLQAAMVGLRDLSVLATPPARRQPVATFAVEWDPAVVREALLRERARNGQSFVVSPRVEDLGRLEGELRALVPELDLAIVHGRLPAEAVDDAMLRFAGGEGDVLLATNIVESGLDVPCANTMVVWRADRFGLAQLHQLRGRVGRGRVRGVCYLTTAPGTALGRAAAERLRTLQAFDRLGAGFAISARDMDLRGAGDLLGEDQAGHARRVGLGLHRFMVRRAVARAKGEEAPHGWTPEVRVGGVPGAIPADLVPEPETRLRLYARACRLESEEAAAGFADEMEDRFGPPPPAMRDWLGLTALRVACRRHGVARLEAGPKAVAATFHDTAARDAARRAAAGAADLHWQDERLLLARPTDTAAARLAAARDLLERLAGGAAA